MRFGLFLMGTRGGSYRDILEQVSYAEQLGFDTVLIAERHFQHGDLLCPSPFNLAAAVAARTKRIRIATAARVLPLSHPLHVAEDAATLDILSNGRLDFGVTRASLDEQCHEIFDSPLDESRNRCEEALEIITRAWTSEKFSFQGKFYQIPEVSVSPKPVQSPHPPIYLVTVSPESIQFAARKGYSAFMPGTRSVDELQGASRSYWQSYEDAGHRGNGHNGHSQLSINRFVYVAASDKEARRDIEQPFMEFIHRRAPDLRAALVQKYGGDGDLKFERFLDDFCIFGSPHTVARRLKELRDEVQMSYVLCTLNFITLEHDTCVRSMEMLAEHVMPELSMKAAATKIMPNEEVA